jgi:hypothetical protein
VCGRVVREQFLYDADDFDDVMIMMMLMMMMMIDDAK